MLYNNFCFICFVAKYIFPEEFSHLSNEEIMEDDLVIDTIEEESYEIELHGIKLTVNLLPHDIREFDKREFTIGIHCGIAFDKDGFECDGLLKITDMDKKFREIKKLQKACVNEKIYGYIKSSPIIYFIPDDCRCCT